MRNSIICIIMLALSTMNVTAQTGYANEPVSYIGGEICNPRLHDGGFKYAIGVENIQVMRANRTHPEQADGYGWTYNHAPNITRWNGKFYLQYLSNPIDEQQPPGQTLLVTSVDGRTWGKPFVAFPPYKAPKGVTFPEGFYGYIMHQRMGFYTAPNGRLLIVAFYGHSYSPFKEGGIGRVVREMHKDGTMGDIYFIRYSSHTTWNESNTAYPFYTKSKDKGFKEACKALLNDKLRTLQWIDEDRGLDGFYALKDSINTVQATSYYHRQDGKTVALWKKSWAALSSDNGASWSTPVKVPSLIMAGGKIWGQRTSDDRYALCYNPIETQPYRYPLIVTTSDDGIAYDDMCVVHGEVPPRRFFGENKDFGPCYVRGICEGEQSPDDNCMWIAYSVNKEDMWVSRIPLPISTQWQGQVDDDFDDIEPNSPIESWNIYRSKWANVFVDSRHMLCLTDSDRYDYARAMRVFEPSHHVSVAFDVVVEQESSEPFEIGITDAHGARAVKLLLHKGEISNAQGVIGHYEIGQKKTIQLFIDTDGLGKYIFEGHKYQCLQAVKSVERLYLTTGLYRDKPDRNTPNQDKCPPLEGCDEQATPSKYAIDNIIIK